MSAKPICCGATTDAIGLTELPEGTVARVVSVGPGTSGTPVELSKRLAELGFLPGERVRVLGRGWFAREPLAVRVGTGTFALRLFEAACVQVCPEPAPTA
jgi:ferrous iron transport protein A